MERAVTIVAEHGGELTRNLAITRQDGCMTDVTFDHASLHVRSLDDPEGFWLEAASGVDWITRPKGALDASSAPLYRWFPDARLNTCYNALDRHVIAGRADQPALIHDSAVTGTSRTYTYAELLDEVARLAGVLQALGVEKGDRVVIYMPMSVEGVVAMQACARIGATHSVVFGGFAARELAVRIDDCTPKAIIAASCGLEPNRVVHYNPLLDAAIDQAETMDGPTVAWLRAAGAAIESSGYRPWFELPFRIPGGEVESGLFAMQAALGGIVLGFVVGKLHERRKGKRA